MSVTGQDKILIVEDDTIIAITIEGRLKEFGYKVVGRASTAQDAIKKTIDLEPDLVLMDIHLKGPVDGIEAAKTIYGIYNIPVVYLTAFSDENTLERAQKTSPFGYIVKPFNDSTLKTTIRLALLKYSAEKKDREINDLMTWE
jgi:DNA-binding NarL/FixJ family response regulator